MERLDIAFIPRIADIDQQEWDALAHPAENPLLSWGYLALLEASGSICPRTGWKPAHLTARRGDRLIAAAPMYIRSDSWGDYVFDFEFAAYAEKLRAPYYPRLVGTVPATPACVWRILGAEADPELAAVCLGAAREAALRSRLAGFNVLWVDPGFLPHVRAAETRAAEWQHQYYLWKNEGYRDFPDCLDSWTKNMRRNVLRERRSVRDSGIETCIIHPAACPPEYLRFMADCYEDTMDRFGPWAARFLTREFFTLLPDYMPTGWLLSAAFAPGSSEPEALAFLIEGQHRLFGRFWGKRGSMAGEGKAIPGLHFEVCFYTPMDYVIERGLSDFDPGMGSGHKARRGFQSFLCSSMHRPFDRRMLQVFQASLPAINDATTQSVATLNTELPFKAEVLRSHMDS